MDWVKRGRSAIVENAPHSSKHVHRSASRLTELNQEESPRLKPRNPAGMISARKVINLITAVIRSQLILQINNPLKKIP